VRASAAARRSAICSGVRLACPWEFEIRQQAIATPASNRPTFRVMVFMATVHPGFRLVLFRAFYPDSNLAACSGSLTRTIAQQMWDAAPGAVQVDRNRKLCEPNGAVHRQ